MGSLFSTFQVLIRFRRESVTPPTDARTCWSNPLQARQQFNCVMVLAKREDAAVTGSRQAIEVLPHLTGMRRPT
jgi:hypothetical protein